MSLVVIASGERRRTPRSPSTSRKATNAQFSRRRSDAASPSCSKDRPAAARRASSPIWRRGSGLNCDTIACHDDLTAADLTGRYLIKNNETIWTDGPLTRAVRRGGICYLDEVVEARKDVTVVLHPLTDDRRILPLDRTGETLHAPDDFMLVISYNPGYQSVLKTLKPSTRQRFVALAFDYPQARGGSRHRCARERTRRRSMQDAGAPRRTVARAEGAGSGGRRLDPSAGRLRQPDGRRHEARATPSKPR